MRYRFLRFTSGSPGFPNAKHKEWEGECIECGALFTFKTAVRQASPSYLGKCPECKMRREKPSIFD